MTAGDIGFEIVVNSAPYLMTSGTAALDLQLMQTPRAAHMVLALTIQTAQYTDRNGNVYPAFTAATYITNGTEFGNPPVGGVFACALVVQPAGGNRFTSPVGKLTVNAVLAP